MWGEDDILEDRDWGLGDVLWADIPALDEDRGQLGVSSSDGRVRIPPQGGSGTAPPIR